MSIERIKEVKTALFTIDVDSMFILFKSQIMSHPGKIDQREKLVSAANDPDTVVEIKKRIVEDLQISNFFFVLLFQVLKDANVCII